MNFSEIELPKLEILSPAFFPKLEAFSPTGANFVITVPPTLSSLVPTVSAPFVKPSPIFSEVCVSLSFRLFGGRGISCWFPEALRNKTFFLY